MKLKNSLLCILDGMCHPPKTGGDQAVYNALKVIQNQLELHLIVVGYNKENLNLKELERDLSQTKITLYDIRHKNKYEVVNAIFDKVRKGFLKLIGQNQSLIVREGIHRVNFERYADLYDFINQYIISNRIEIVQFEFSRALYWGQAIYAPVKKIFVQHEIQYIVKKQRFHGKKLSSLEKIRYQIERNCELEAMNAYDAIITLSENDKDKLLRDGINTNVYPSFAKVQYRRDCLSDYKNAKVIDLVFVGPETHKPNRQGMSWFMNNVWKKVFLSFNNITLHIVGKWSNETIRKWSKEYPNIVFEGFVDDLSEMLRNKILIVPIFEGSGIRMKILEAANTGTPFVGTSIGAEGLGFESRKNCIIANNEDDFFEAIKFLLTSREELIQIASMAYEHANTAFSDERFIETRMKAYRSLLTPKMAE